MALQTRQSRRVDPRWWWLAGCLCLLAVGLGCSPSTIAFLFMPFVDDKIQPRCKLSKKGEEVTVVVYATFASRGEIPLDLEPAANEVMEILSVHLRQRFAANKEKVAIVSPTKVRSFMNSRLGKGHSDEEIGDHFKADYVVALEIQSFSLFGGGSTVLQGKTNIRILVTDLKAPGGDARVLNEVYSTSFPKSHEEDASSASPTQFRARFINHIARDLSRWFAAFPREERMDMN